MTLSKKFAALLIAASAVSGCATNGYGGYGMPPGTGRMIGTAIGAGAGVAVSNNSNSTFMRYAGPMLGAAAGNWIGGVLEGPPPPCNRSVVIDNRTGQTTYDTSNCNIQHGIPAGMPPVIYGR